MTSRQDHEATRAFGSKVDFGRAASDYRTFRAGFPLAFFEALQARGWIAAGMRALDLGTGTGTVARGLAARGLSVTGIDPSAALLAEAAALDGAAGLSVAYRTGRAESLADPDASVDLVTVGQCWHWFERPRAAAEAARVLVPGGRLVVAHFDWLPRAGNVVEATEALILAVNPAWTLAGGNGLYPDWLRDLAEAGFGSIETFSFDVDVPFSHADWRGRIRASAGIRASLPPEAVERFDIELAAVLAERFPDEPLAVPHRVWAASGIKS